MGVYSLGRQIRTILRRVQRIAVRGIASKSSVVSEQNLLLVFGNIFVGFYVDVHIESGWA